MKGQFCLREFFWDILWFYRLHFVHWPLVTMRQRKQTKNKIHNAPLSCILDVIITLLEDSGIYIYASKNPKNKHHKLHWSYDEFKNVSAKNHCMTNACQIRFYKYLKQQLIYKWKLKILFWTKIQSVLWHTWSNLHWKKMKTFHFSIFTFFIILQIFQGVKSG